MNTHSGYVPRLFFLLGAMLMSAWCQAADAAIPTPDEMALARQWATAKFETSKDIPFSFTYGGAPSASLLPTWERQTASRKLDEQRTEHTLSYADPKTGLVARCVAVEYIDFPTVEWTVYFKNTGRPDTPILADIQALDRLLQCGTNGEFLLHYTSARPLRQRLRARWKRRCRRRPRSV